MAARDDYYRVLGVGRTATQEEIQRAYRKLAREHHPDVNRDPAAEERFKDVSEAYSVLSDPAARRRYDAFGPDFRQVPDDVDPHEWGRARAGDGAGAGGWRPGGPGRARAGPPPGGFGGAGPQGVDIEDLLGGMFGAGRGWGPVPGADQEAEITLTVEEAYRGGRRTITIGGPGGRRTLDVTIPRGVTEGQRIRLAGQGGHGGGDAPRGDLYLVAHLAPHPRYRVEGRDLHVALPLAPWEAALGTDAVLDTPDGEAKVKVPAGTSSGRRLRLRGRGLPSPRGGAGDLLAEVAIVVPATLTSQERGLFERLAAVSGFQARGGR